MHTLDAIERLEAAAPTVEVLVDADEEERILARIVASDRRPVLPRRRPRVLLLLAGAGIVAAAVAVVVTGAFRSASPPAPARTGDGHGHIALTGPRIELAGYHFRTPAGFEASKASCDQGAGGGNTPANGFSSAASADGGCVEAFFEIPGGAGAPQPIPADADAVTVGAYQGFFVSQGSSGAILYVELPKTADAGQPVYLALFSQGLAEDQLIAVAASGLPPAS
jgi:hypothetical protein